MNDQDGSKAHTDWLVLIPTSFEADKIASSLTQPSVHVEVCGFGPILPAAKTVRLIQLYQPNHVVLVGIAGSYSPNLGIGNAYRFSSVTCDGIGAGEGAGFQSAAAMGWSQGTDANGNPISNTLDLTPNSGDDKLQLLTVCSAADGEQMTQSRRGRYPEAVAEDMEGFSVAAACRVCNLELTIIRGISNLAGDRDKANWKIDQALASASKLALKVTGSQT